LRRLQRADLEN